MGTFGASSPADDDLAALTNREVWERYSAVDREIGEDGDPAEQAAQLDRLAADLIRRAPDQSEFWYDRGMYAKWRRDWTLSLRCNERALELIAEGQRAQEPAAWNLAIAATALRDWRRARHGWRAFGVEIPEGTSPADPIMADFGPSPVRLNPEPRFAGELPVTIDGQEYSTEVVWGLRLDPARIRILNVPSPESGHRFGDIVLHDGDTLGTRMLGDQELGVFNEIALWKRSSFCTVTASVVAPAELALDELITMVEDAGGAAENWTQSVNLLCRRCSEGSPGDHHHDASAADWSRPQSMGLAGAADQLRTVLNAWQGAGPDREVRDLEIALT